MADLSGGMTRQAEAAAEHGEIRTVFRELTGITQQIEQNLLEPHGVYGQDAQVYFRFDGQAVLVLLCQLSGGADDLINKPSQVHRLGIEVELAGFDLREVQYLVDET